MGRRIAALLVVAAAVATVGATAVGSAATSGGCGDLESGTCGVTGQDNHFHGLIAVHGSPWLLDVAARSGAEPGCGDCEWSIVLACPAESLSDPTTLQACAGASNSPVCQPGQLLYRVYLSTDAFLDRVQGTVCLGGSQQVVPVGDQAAADVARYLDNVTPPDLAVVTRPVGATLAGLPTWFAAHPPAGIDPVRFGGSGVTETITISPIRVDWSWGDGDASGWIATARQLRHSFRRGGMATVRLTVRWGARYTITYDGETFGPYDAAGQLTKAQPLRLPVRTSTPVLVSR